jgi:hypothetical protein
MPLRALLFATLTRTAFSRLACTQFSPVWCSDAGGCIGGLQRARATIRDVAASSSVSFGLAAKNLAELFSGTALRRC